MPSRLDHKHGEEDSMTGDEETVDAELEDTSGTPKTKVDIPQETETHMRGLVSAPLRRGKGRRPAPTIRQAKAGLALANGAKSLGAAMREAGYAASTAMTPARNGVTPGKLLAAAAEVFPGAPTATSIKRDGLDLIQRAMQQVRNDPDARPLELAQIGGGAAKLGHEIGGGDEQDTDLQAAAAHEAFNVHQAQRDLTLALRITAAGADVPGILAELHKSLAAAQASQAAFQLRHGTKVLR